MIFDTTAFCFIVYTLNFQYSELGCIYFSVIVNICSCLVLSILFSATNGYTKHIDVLTTSSLYPNFIVNLSQKSNDRKGVGFP